MCHNQSCLSHTSEQPPYNNRVGVHAPRNAFGRRQPTPQARPQFYPFQCVHCKSEFRVGAHAVCTRVGAPLSNFAVPHSEPTLARFGCLVSMAS
jgi:hypothetical protein